MAKKRKDPPNEVRYSLKPLSTQEALKKALEYKPAKKSKPKPNA